ncbi:MAG: LysR substrate-binding domain-containing protein, partial [Paracoccaceae bacterium]|nr:LysR substrate-binding domain-containing protein [Paracoccaceae bacterium]
RAARDLEKILDLKFYVKTLQGYDLTRSATMIARAARLMFAELDQAIMEIAEWQGKDSSEITIGGLPLARSTILPQTLSRLSRARPKMRIRVVEGPYSDLLHALRHGEIDVVVGALRFPPPADDVVQETLFKDRLGVFAGPNHPLAHKGKLNIDDLALYPWVMPHSETPTRAIFERFMAALATPEHRNVIETSSMVLVRSLLQDNEHLTMLSVNQMHFDEDAGSVCRLPVELEDAPRPIGVTSRTDWHPTSAQSEFLEILREVSLTFG